MSRWVFSIVWVFSVYSARRFNVSASPPPISMVSTRMKKSTMTGQLLIHSVKSEKIFLRETPHSIWLLILLRSLEKGPYPRLSAAWAMLFSGETPVRLVSVTSLMKLGIAFSAEKFLLAIWRYERAAGMHVVTRPIATNVARPMLSVTHENCGRSWVAATRAKKMAMGMAPRIYGLLTPLSVPGLI